MHATPEDGDVVVRQQTLEGRRVYVFHTGPGPGQFLFRSHEEAVEQAARFAKRQGVRAWLTDEGCNLVLLDVFRQGAATASRQNE